MTAKKLKIIDPYTPEHPGPFCTRSGAPVRIICKDRKGKYPIVALVDKGDEERTCGFTALGIYCLDSSDIDLMNAEEVPVAREFWVNVYTHGIVHTFNSEAIAKSGEKDLSFIRTIHVREVLPGDE